MSVVRATSPSHQAKGEFSVPGAFVSYSSHDRHFVDLLAAILVYHRIPTWCDYTSIEPGQKYDRHIAHGLSEADVLVVIASGHAIGSTWIAREIATFAATDPSRVIVPMLLDEVDLDRIYPGLGERHALRCNESMLEAVSKLVRLFGKTLFPEIENRKTDGDRRKRTSDRRTSTVEHRFRFGLWKNYELASGFTRESEMSMLASGRFANHLCSEQSGLRSYRLKDRRTGDEVTLDPLEVRKLVSAAWTELQAEYLLDSVYVVEAVANALLAAYLVEPRELRKASAQRRQRDDVSAPQDLEAMSTIEAGPRLASALAKPLITFASDEAARAPR
jgi:TIR domain